MADYSALLFLMILTVPIARAQTGSAAVAAKPVRATVCEIAQNPSAFNNKFVKVRGYVSVGFEFSILEAEGCSDAIWFALGDGSGPPGLVATANGKGMPGGKTSKGKAVLPLRVKLVRDSIFEKFQRYMTVKAQAKPCFDDLTHPTSVDCGVERVSATFIGRVDGVCREMHAAHLKRSGNSSPDFKGFGQMGSFDAQLVVQSVEDVLAVDVFGREKP